MTDVYLERKCRETGTTVALSSPGVTLFKEEGWVTICVEHGGCMCHRTRKLAEQWWSHPKDWCPTCMENWTGAPPAWKISRAHIKSSGLLFFQYID